jgi:hypothetical protein
MDRLAHGELLEGMMSVVRMLTPENPGNNRFGAGGCFRQRRRSKYIIEQMYNIYNLFLENHTHEWREITNETNKTDLQRQTTQLSNIFGTFDHSSYS